MGKTCKFVKDKSCSQGQLINLLNIEAIRNPENTANNVIAGIRVTRLQINRKLKFSEPAFTRQRSVILLAKGEGLDKVVMDSSQMTAMLIGLGVGQSGQLAGGRWNL